jgi:hypothetical protein
LVGYCTSPPALLPPAVSFSHPAAPASNTVAALAAMIRRMSTTALLVRALFRRCCAGTSTGVTVAYAMVVVVFVVPGGIGKSLRWVRGPPNIGR